METHSAEASWGANPCKGSFDNACANIDALPLPTCGMPYKHKCFKFIYEYFRQFFLTNSRVDLHWQMWIKNKIFSGRIKTKITKKRDSI